MDGGSLQRTIMQQWVSLINGGVLVAVVVWFVWSSVPSCKKRVSVIFLFVHGKYIYVYLLETVAFVYWCESGCLSVSVTACVDLPLSE
jgi:hypothetical protein